MQFHSTEKLYLAAVGSQKDRELISEDDIQGIVQEEIKHMKSSLQRIRVAYYLLGLKATDPFYQMMRSSMYTAQRTTLCPRVRFDQRYQTPSFAWERIHQHIVAARTGGRPQTKAGAGRSYMAFVRRKGAAKKEKAKVVLTAEHVPINKKSLSISPSAFDNEPEWARVSGLLIDRKLSELRKRTRALSHISRAIVRFADGMQSRESPKDDVV